MPLKFKKKENIIQAHKTDQICYYVLVSVKQVQQIPAVVVALVL